MEHGPGRGWTDWPGRVKKPKSKGGVGEKILVVFPFYEHRRLFAFFFSFIDNSKYFPGRQLSVMIWTAASAISSAAS